MIRALWDVEQPGAARVEGAYYRLDGAARGPAPLHDIGIWVGAYKPRMLRADRAQGRRLAAQPAVPQAGRPRGGQRGDRRGRGRGRPRSGRDPPAAERARRRSPAAEWVEELTRLALEDGIGTFILTADDAARHRDAGRRRSRRPCASGSRRRARRAGDGARAAAHRTPTRRPTGVGVRPARRAADARRRHAPQRHRAVGRVDAPAPRPSPAPRSTYTRRGRLVGQHLVDVHDMLRTRAERAARDPGAGARRRAAAPATPGRRSTRWRCARTTGRSARSARATAASVAQHHGLEDDAIFPHLARSDRALEPVIERLADEHLVIHDAIQAVDHALVDHINHPDDYAPDPGGDRRPDRRAALAPLLRGARDRRAARPARLLSRAGVAPTRRRARAAPSGPAAARAGARAR